MSKRSKKENELLNYLSEDERKVYEEFEARHSMQYTAPKIT